MKYQELYEKVYFSFPSKYDKSKEVHVFKNPNNPEMNAALSKTKFNELRGLLVGNVVYVWDANLSIHDEVQELLGIEDAKKFIIVDDILIPAEEKDNEEFFLSNPMIKRMLGLLQKSEVDE